MKLFFYGYIVEGTVLAKVVVNWSFWLGFSDLIMARLIAGNLLCLELLTNFGWLSYGIDKHFKSSDVVYIKLQQWMNFSVVNWSW